MPRDTTAQRVPHQHEPVQLESSDKRLDKIGIGLDGVFAARPGARQAMPRKIDRDQSRFVAQFPGPSLPHMQRTVGTVKQNDRNAARIALHADVGVGSGPQLEETREKLEGPVRQPIGMARRQCMRGSLLQYLQDGTAKKRPSIALRIVKWLSASRTEVERTKYCSD